MDNGTTWNTLIYRFLHFKALTLTICCLVTRFKRTLKLCCEPNSAAVNKSLLSPCTSLFLHIRKTSWRYLIKKVVMNLSIDLYARIIIAYYNLESEIILNKHLVRLAPFWHGRSHLGTLEYDQLSTKLMWMDIQCMVCTYSSSNASSTWTLSFLVAVSRPLAIVEGFAFILPPILYFKKSSTISADPCKQASWKASIIDSPLQPK